MSTPGPVTATRATIGFCAGARLDQPTEKSALQRDIAALMDRIGRAVGAPFFSYPCPKCHERTDLEVEDLPEKGISIPCKNGCPNSFAIWQPAKGPAQ